MPKLHTCLPTNAATQEKGSESGEMEMFLLSLVCECNLCGLDLSPVLNMHIDFHTGRISITVPQVKGRS